MKNYEINILRRGGNWKKVKPDDFIIDEINNESKDVINSKKEYKSENFLSFVTKVDSIIFKLETLENEKNKLKDELKIYENEFLKKKKIAQDKIIKISEEKEIINKKINLIKNLKNF